LYWIYGTRDLSYLSDLLSFREKCCSKTSGLNILDSKQGFCENLSAVGFSDNSVDAVVVTLVLCSVNDQEKSIAEIRRVLKPGGKFFYMEHILADESRQWHRMFQKALMTGGFWPFVADGCCTDRSTDLEMESAGFIELQQKRYDLPLGKELPIQFRIMGKVVQPHVMGVATK